jgi:adenosylcobinamide kinase/adenosylcobinamide-phosphate guanylyltransferase
MSTMTIARSELILGGQKSGKSRRAEQLAQQWLAQSNEHRAVLVATARPWDDEMRERILRHQQDRAERVPGMVTVEEPLQLAQALTRHSAANTLVVFDCLTLWLTNLLMPAGPLVLVGNEIGLGVIPLGRETRAFVDALGQLNQQVAAACARVTLMAAGLPLALKAPL